jgi:hypothetical protein
MPAVVAPQRQEDHPLDPAGRVGLDRQSEGEALGRRLAQRQGELLDLHLLPPQRALGRLLGRAAVEPYWHAIAVAADDEVGAVVQHLEPGVVAGGGGPLQAVAAEGEGAAADRPGIIAQFVAGHRQRIAAGIGQHAGADPQPLLGQGGMEVPGQARRRRRRRFGMLHGTTVSWCRTKTATQPWQFASSRAPAKARKDLIITSLMEARHGTAAGQ